MHLLSALVRSRRAAWSTLVLALLGVGALFALLPSSGSTGSPDVGLPADAESQQVTDLLQGFPDADGTVAVLVWTRGGDGLTDEDRAAITARATGLADLSTVPQAVRPQFSDDGTAATVVVPVESAASDDDAAADRLRAAAGGDLPAGLDAALTGPVGFAADIRGAFAGADFRLLLVTVAVVAVLLIATYRSPVLWLVPLIVVGTADGLARIVVAALAGVAGVTIDASIAGILSVLVFGAGTNYALLLVARYREELRVHESRYEAMSVAVRAAGPTILASGGTVTLGLLTLLLADLAGNRALGFACAVGIVLAMAFAVLVLPAALVVCGRGLFWPFVPRPGETVRAPLWGRLGERVSRAPAIVAGASLAGLGVLALGLAGYAVGLPRIEQLVGTPASVTAQQVLDRAFPDVRTPTVTLLAPSAAADDVVALATGTEGVVDATAGEEHGGTTRIDVTLDAQPESEDAVTSVTRLRDAIAADGSAVGDTLVGGSDATALDARDLARGDLLRTAPLILVVVLLVLVLLLRSLLGPLILLASVLATFFASLGAGTWLFQHVFGFAALDTSVTLYAFLFLVALGVDYNIFLLSRVREERPEHGTRGGMVRALGATGAVITSAGVLLAAVFAVLGVLPVVALTQIGVIVCIGVLLDTLVVRTLLVPALTFLVGDRFWWPTRRPQSRAGAGRKAS